MTNRPGDELSCRGLDFGSSSAWNMHTEYGFHTFTLQLVASLQRVVFLSILSCRFTMIFAYERKEDQTKIPGE